MAFAPLYNQKVIQKEFAKDEITTLQRKRANEWIRKIKNNELKKEVENYKDFRDTVLIDLLGYPREEIKFEEKDVEFSLKDDKGRTHVVFEAKGTKTKDLFARQNYGKREQEHPVLQTVSNMQRFAPPAAYGVCTNYNDFVLLDRELGITKCHRFTFTDIANNIDKLKEFIGIFSYKKLVLEKSLVTLYKTSITKEKDFTKEFYKLFHETRLMMIKAFQEKEEVEEDEAIHYAQLMLNRLIFVFFEEDKGDIEERLFTKRILKILDVSQCTEFSKSIFEDIQNLFTALNKGSDIMGIFGFNGGLFKESIPPKIYFYDLKDPSFFSNVKKNSKYSKKMVHDEFSAKVLNTYKDNLNPIISNLLLLDSFDFRTEINVNILGHIFEQSIGDLEILTGKVHSKRKKDGIYYTPEYVTDYICRNTIIPYLSKNNSTTVMELISEYFHDPDELEERIKKIKILDPACGSGAFLIKAAELLFEIDNEIQSRKPVVMKQKELEEFSKEKEIVKIIEQNIFGIDINNESVDITKLSMFLKMATVNRKLIDLSKNIQVGNSLINDSEIDSNSVEWEKRFKKITDNGGFDIILGNPPYIPIDNMTEREKLHYANNYKGIFRKYDTSILFVEKSLSVLKPKGILGIIMPLTWQTGDNYKTFRELIFRDSSLKILVNLPFDVFEDAYVDTGIAIFTKDKISKFRGFDYNKNEKIKSIEDYRGSFVSRKRIIPEDFKVFPNESTYRILDKANKNCEKLGVITQSTQGIVTSKYTVSSKKESKDYLPFLKKAESNRYLFQKCSTAFIDSSEIKSILHLYIVPKLFLRRIINRQDRIMCLYDDSGIITNKDYNPFKIISKDYDIFYILGLLNSKLISYLYVKKSAIALKDDFRQTTLAELRSLPIKKAKQKQSDEISKKVQKLNKIINEHFKLKEIILEKISSIFDMDKNKSLKKFNKIPIEEFKTKIENNSLVENKTKWKNNIYENFNELQSIEGEIRTLDKQIDNNVFLLYEISVDEQETIESTILDRDL